MARASSWETAADAFTKAYGITRGIQKTNRTKKIMDDEQFMRAAGDNKPAGAGFGLSGSELEKARYTALGNLETEFGNAEGGLANRRLVQQIEQGDRDNRVNDATEKYRIRMEGALKEKSMLLNQLLTQAQSNNQNASASLRGGQLDDLNALRDGKVDLNDANVELTNARIAQTEQETVRDKMLMPLDVAGKTQTNLGLSMGNQVTSQTMDGKIDSAKAANALETAQSEQNLSILEQGALILADVNSQKFDPENGDQGQQAQNYMIKKIQSSQIPIAEQAVMISTIQRLGLQNIQEKGLKISALAKNAIQAGGLDGENGLIQYYDKIDGGGTLALVPDGDGGSYKLINTVKDPNSGKDAITVLFSGDKQTIQGQLEAQLTQPGTAFQVAADILTNEKLASSISVDEQTILNGNNTIEKNKVYNRFVEAQIKKIDAEIKQSDAELGDLDKIKNKGLADLMRSEGYLYILERDVEAANAVVENYKKNFGMLTKVVPTPTSQGLSGAQTTGGSSYATEAEIEAAENDPSRPSNMAAAVWANMTVGEKSLFPSK